MTTTSKNEEGEKSDETECFCWKKRRKRRGRRLSWEGGGGGGGGGGDGRGTTVHSGDQPPRKSSEASSAVSPTGAIAVVAVVLFGKQLAQC